MADIDAMLTQYTTILKNHITEPVYVGFKHIYDKAVEYNETKKLGEDKVIESFQDTLRTDVPTWTSKTIETETMRIRNISNLHQTLDEIHYTVRLLRMMVLTRSSTLDQIATLNKEIYDKNLEQLIHTIYVNSAKEIYLTPLLFYHKLPITEMYGNRQRIIRTINATIDKCLLMDLPMNKILQITNVNLNIDRNIVFQENLERGLGGIINSMPQLMMKGGMYGLKGPESLQSHIGTDDTNGTNMYGTNNDASQSMRKSSTSIATNHSSRAQTNLLRNPKNASIFDSAGNNLIYQKSRKNESASIKTRHKTDTTVKLMNNAMNNIEDGSESLSQPRRDSIIKRVSERVNKDKQEHVNANDLSHITESVNRQSVLKQKSDKFNSFDNLFVNGDSKDNGVNEQDSVFRMDINHDAQLSHMTFMN